MSNDQHGLISGKTEKDSTLYKIYGLVDPRDNKIFYVGRTAIEIERRLHQHLNEANKTTLKQQRITTIEKNNYLPITIVVLEANVLSERRAFCREVFWMETLLNAGAELTNASVDYNGVYFFREDTLETRQTRDYHLDKATPETSTFAGDRDQYIAPYTNASENWCQDKHDPNAPLQARLDDMDGQYFMVERVVRNLETLARCNLSLHSLNEKRLKNLDESRLLNHGMPILDEEITELLRRYESNRNLAMLEQYFQRSRKSLQWLIDEHFVSE